MKTRKNNLDERQEQILLKIEHVGCWLAYWGLLAAILIQEIVYKGDFRYVLGEWVVFMALCLYVLYGCLKNGIWDRHLRPTAKHNAIASIVAGCVVGLFTAALTTRSFPSDPKITLMIAAAAGAAVFVLCFAALTVAAAATKRKQKQMEEAPEEDEPDIAESMDA